MRVISGSQASEHWGFRLYTEAVAMEMFAASRILTAIEEAGLDIRVEFVMNGNYLQQRIEMALRWSRELDRRQRKGLKLTARMNRLKDLESWIVGAKVWDRQRPGILEAQENQLSEIASLTDAASRIAWSYSGQVEPGGIVEDAAALLLPVDVNGEST
jgi:hypothetical protein